VLEGNRQRSVTPERRPADQQLERDHTQGVEVGPLVGPLAVHLLRGHVVGRTQDGAGSCQAAAVRGLGEPEVQQLDRSGGGQHHVLGFEVAVDDAGRVHCR